VVTNALTLRAMRITVVTALLRAQMTKYAKQAPACQSAPLGRLPVVSFVSTLGVTFSTAVSVSIPAALAKIA
jgi:hypothetical protein